MRIGSARRGAVVAVSMVLLALAGAAPALAQFSLGDAANFAVLYEGNNNQQLQFNNSNVTGNIGIGYGFTGTSGQMQANGPGTITGNIEFAAADSGQYSNSGVTVTGTVTYGNANVQADLTCTTGCTTGITDGSVNQLSKTLGSESGTKFNITGGGSVNVTSGNLVNGNYIFAATLSSFNNGTTFTINGTSSQYVVFNIPNTTNGFNGEIVLTGGITSDHVLFNLDGGNYSTLMGGSTLTISTNGGVTTGTFLDPNGDIQINHSVLDGRLFGGDTDNLSIVSGANVNAPLNETPEPASMALLGTFLLGAYALLRRFVKP